MAVEHNNENPDNPTGGGGGGTGGGTGGGGTGGGTGTGTGTDRTKVSVTPTEFQTLAELFLKSQKQQAELNVPQNSIVSQPETGSNTTAILVLLLLVAGGGFAFWYFKNKGKHNHNA